MDNPIEITLKNGILKPTTITLSPSTSAFGKMPSILLKVINQKPQSMSDLYTTRKYIFSIEQTDEETQPLSNGQTHLFENFNGYENGKYHLTCINYPKLQCEIQVINQEVPIANQRKSNTIINLSGLQSVQEKQQQNKEDFGKEENQEVKSQQLQNNFNNNPLGTPKKADLSDYDKILSSEKYIEETIQNRYLRYFQQQFKIWRKFFNDQQDQHNNQQQKSTPIKQKPKSQQRKNSDNNIEQNKIDNWSKRQNYSPNLKFTLSCGSPSNNQNLSQFDKQKSQLSIKHSHQDNYRIDDELDKQTKTMKKTNSQYRLNIQDIVEKKDSQAQTASKSKQKKCKKTGSFMEWLDSWAQGEQPVLIKQKEDENVIKQWLSHIKNKYKISKFMYD